jgi:hypothetical protein
MTNNKDKGPKSSGNLNIGLLYIFSIMLIDFLSIMAIIKKDTIIKLLDNILLSDLIKLRKYNSRALERA